MKYVVFGVTEITVSIEVEAENENEALEKADKQFKGIHSYAGNGGDKLIGVEGKSETIAADAPVEFNDCMII